MQNLLPLVYLSFLLVLLGAITFLLIQEVSKKRSLEAQLYELQKKVRESNGTPEDYYLLGTIYLSKKLFDQAIIQFRCALKTWDKKDVNGLANLYNTIGFTYFESNQYDLAIYYYKEALKEWKNYTTAWNNLGYAYEKKKMNLEALKSYKAVIAYEVENEIALAQIQTLTRKIKIRDDRI